jgi:hypothetical protein
MKKKNTIFHFFKKKMINVQLKLNFNLTFFLSFFFFFKLHVEEREP